jgi:hypothetical protein
LKACAAKTVTDNPYDDRRTHRAARTNHCGASRAGHCEWAIGFAAPAEIPGDHELPSRPAGVPKPGTRVALTGVDQLWVADITIFGWKRSLLGGHSGCVLAAGDWFGTRSHLGGELTVATLHMALERRIPPLGVVDHSDHGRQCASQNYNDLLKAREITHQYLCLSQGTTALKHGPMLAYFIQVNVGSVSHHHQHI